MAFMEFREPNQVQWIGSRPAHNGEQAYGHGVVTNGTATIYTVPAGVALYITNFWSNTWAGGAGGVGAMVIYDTTPAIWYELSRAKVQSSFTSGIAAGFPFPIEVPAGYTIRLYSANANCTQYGGFAGWVE